MGVCQTVSLIKQCNKRLGSSAPAIGIQRKADDATADQIKADPDIFAIGCASAAPGGYFEISGKSVEEIHLGGLLLVAELVSKEMRICQMQVHQARVWDAVVAPFRYCLAGHIEQLCNGSVAA